MESKAKNPVNNAGAVWEKDCAGGSSSIAAIAEADIQRSVQAIIRELDQEHPAFQCSRGMFRWTLHKKTERDPYNSNFLVKILIGELELAKKNNKHYILPLLNTLMYAIIQAAYIPDNLYEKAYTFCKGLLSFPKPYCTIGHQYAVMLKAERKAPGFLYQRVVISEHGLKNDTFSHREKIFIFADPDLISEEVIKSLHNEIHSVSLNDTSAVNMSHIIKHSIQATLGENCDISKLDVALQNKPYNMIEHYFQEVVAVTEQSYFSSEEVTTAHRKHSSKLQQLYKIIINSAQQVPPSERLQNILLPNPNIGFFMWKEDDLLWKELVQFVKNQLDGSQDFIYSDPDTSEMSETTDCHNIEQIRLSVLSTDSGIVRDCGDPTVGSDASPSRSSDTNQTKLSRKGCVKKRNHDSENALYFPDIYDNTTTCNDMNLHRKFGCNVMSFSIKQLKPNTARVVVIGNDCILGRLAQAYHSLRKREARRGILTAKLNLLFYYIPVTNEKQSPVSAGQVNHLLHSDLSCELSRYLGSIDPWYNSNINSLRNMIPELAKMSTTSGQQSGADPFIVDVTSYYVRMGCQPVCFQIYSVKLTFSDETDEIVDDVFLIQLEAEFPEQKCVKETTLVRRRAISEGVGGQIAVTYKKIALSNRECIKQLASHCTGVVMKAIPSTRTEDLVCLNVSISEVTSKTNLSGKTSLTEDVKIKTSHVRIKVQDNCGKSMAVCLDKDSRRTYKDVISIDVSPCLEPGYCLHKMRASRFNQNETENIGLTKYMPKCLLLPINTFAGIL
ncbi:phosphoinositide 3-kinase regulatory subunit 6-like isoform X2 [Pristis pectinata]|uniref:phosphoinositide 3-kinase regulatory subunit 6-like isoform X2 n=1 Tax=Pristis pectinata TaxID=685728 RepID=UPI00223D1803|nr:phosphoinositide 3-kinase regulatory subunit 6-like isoform X2 [Pristis pectinata]